jgi:hypothetical protein
MLDFLIKFLTILQFNHFLKYWRVGNFAFPLFWFGWNLLHTLKLLFWKLFFIAVTYYFNYHLMKFHLSFLFLDWSWDTDPRRLSYRMLTWSLVNHEIHESWSFRGVKVKPKKFRVKSLKSVEASRTHQKCNVHLSL